MKKQIIEHILKWAGRILKNKNYNNVLKEQEKKIRINLGCGLNYLSSWINIDGSLTALLKSKNKLVSKIIYNLAGSSAYFSFDDFYRLTSDGSLFWYDLSKRIPFKDETVDIVFSSHFLEHLNKDDGKKFIFETYRVLKNNGLLRLVLPDLDIAIQHFNEGKINQTLNLFFYTSNDYSFSAHKYNYNFDTLKLLCEEAGFKEITKMKYQVGSCPDISSLDVYPDHSLYIEALK